MLKRHEIKDTDWEQIKDLLPPENKGKGRPSRSNRIMLNGMLWIAKTGAPWRELPERFGPWQTVYYRFRLWSKNEIFQKLFSQLSANADSQDFSIDNTSCKELQHADGAEKRQKTAKQTASQE